MSCVNITIVVVIMVKNEVITAFLLYDINSDIRPARFISLMLVASDCSVSVRTVSRNPNSILSTVKIAPRIFSERIFVFNWSMMIWHGRSSWERMPIIIIKSSAIIYG